MKVSHIQIINTIAFPLENKWNFRWQCLSKQFIKQKKQNRTTFEVNVFCIGPDRYASKEIFV